jgi:hypothetical protein
MLGLAAAVAHSTHALSMWRQMQQYKASDPSLSDFFWSKFQTELAVTVVAFFAGVVAWHLFKPRPEQTTQAGPTRSGETASS